MKFINDDKKYTNFFLQNKWYRAIFMAIIYLRLWVGKINRLYIVYTNNWKIFYYLLLFLYLKANALEIDKNNTYAIYRDCRTKYITIKCNIHHCKQCHKRCSRVANLLHDSIYQKDNNCFEINSINYVRGNFFIKLYPVN